MKLKCNICENEIEINENTKPGTRITCPNCFAQLAVYKHKGKLVIGCAMCKESIFDPSNCERCERRQEKRELIKEGRL
jgi:ribosomal protein S27E